MHRRQLILGEVAKCPCTSIDLSFKCNHIEPKWQPKLTLILALHLAKAPETSLHGYVVEHTS